MARLFVFGVGGTGARVLKSLTMLLAAGIKPTTERDYEIVPIIVDPHHDNEDVRRTIRLMENYQNIVDGPSHSDKSGIGISNGFFSTKLTTLNRLGDQERLASSFLFNLNEVANTRFRDHIGLSRMDEANAALTQLLFSGKSIDKSGRDNDILNMEMDIGFVGNPNVGSVILHQFKYSEEFRQFASNFSDTDRIFIISSIFGGTGAAGFPLIVNTIRDAINYNHIDGAGFLHNAVIGGISVLPYFNVQREDDSPIYRSDFISKTQSALHYYKDNLVSKLNALYYISDDFAGRPYDNDPGTGGQKNKAHQVELYAATAIIDFLSIPDGQLQTINGKPQSPVVKEFGLKNDYDTITFDDLTDITNDRLAKPLTQFLVFRKYLEDQLQGDLGDQPWSISEPSITSSLTTSAFYRSYLTEILDAYVEWLKELEGNSRSFAPFNIDTSEVGNIVKNKPIKKGKLIKSVIQYSYITDKLNGKARREDFNNSEEKLVKLFYEVTNDIID